MSISAFGLILGLVGLGLGLAGLGLALARRGPSGVQLDVRLTPAILTADGYLLRGPDQGWPQPPPASLPDGSRPDVYIDLAIITVTNTGRTPGTVTGIALDLGLSASHPGGRHTVAGAPVPVPGCVVVWGEVQLPPGTSVAIAFDHQPLIENALAQHAQEPSSIQATATAVGHLPTLSPWDDRWGQNNGRSPLFGGATTPEREAFVATFRGA